MVALLTQPAIAQPAPDLIWTKVTHSSFVSPVAIASQGNLVASPGPNNSVRLSNLADGSLVRDLFGHTATVAGIAFSPDCGMTASSADDRTLRLWNLTNGILLRTITQGGGNKQFTAVAFAPDGQHVAADYSRTNLALWNTSDGSLTWQTLGNTAEIESIAFSPDGMFVAAAGGYRGLDVTIRIIRASDGQLLHTLITSNTYGVRQLAFSPDGKWLAAGCYEASNFNGGVELWRVSDWSRALRLPVTAPALAFSPDTSLLITLRTRSMDVWRIPQGTLLSTFAPQTDTPLFSPHLSVAVSSNGQTIVTGRYRQIATPNGTLTEGTTSAFRFPVVLNVAMDSNRQLRFHWNGGYTLYQVQRRFLDSTNWINLGEPTALLNLTLPIDQAAALFRVMAISP